MIKYRFKNTDAINFMPLEQKYCSFPYGLFKAGRVLTPDEEIRKSQWEQNAHKHCINIIVDKYITQLERYRADLDLPPLPKNFWTVRYFGMHPERCYLFRSRLWSDVRPERPLLLQ